MGVLQNHLTELLDFIWIQFYSELQLAARSDARPLLQEARHDMATEGPEALAGPQSQEASGSSPSKRFSSLRDKTPEPQPGACPSANGPGVALDAGHPGAAGRDDRLEVVL
jgi:hypothetical protein